jgi:hypothetical protein
LFGVSGLPEKEPALSNDRRKRGHVSAAKCGEAQDLPGARNVTWKTS